MISQSHFNQLKEACVTALQDLSTTTSEAQQQLQTVALPVTHKQELEFLQHRRQQLVVWNNYAAASRRLSAFLEKQRQAIA